MDWLDPDVPVEWLADALDIIRRCPDLTFQCVTKRPELWRPRLMEMRKNYLPETDWGGWIGQWLQGKAPNNMHIIVSVEDQKSADERIPRLLKIPAVVRGVSAEPLLERIDLRFFANLCRQRYGIGWVIVGGESGPNRRDCGVDAIADVVRQCQAAGVPCYVKQDCAAKPGQQGRLPDEVWDVKQFPK